MLVTYSYVAFAKMLKESFTSCHHLLGPCERLLDAARVYIYVSEGGGNIVCPIRMRMVSTGTPAFHRSVAKRAFFYQLSTERRFTHDNQITL